MLPKGNQIAAARALLGWDQKDVAERVGLTVAAISKIEKGENKGKSTTLDAIQSAFEMAGVVFTEHGVELKENVISVIDGDNWYLRLLDDVYFSLANTKNPELLLMCADDSKSPPEVNDLYKKIRSNGVQMRQLVEEGNTYLMGPLNEYRYMPKERFNNYVSLIYGDKVAVCTDANTKALVFKDPLLAKTWKNLFDLMWDVLEQPKKSNANEKF